MYSGAKEILRFYLVASWLVFVAVSPLFAQEQSDADSIHFEVTVSPDTATIGDEITVKIEAEYPEGIDLSEPAMKMSEKSFAMKGDPEVKSKIRGGRKLDQYTFVLSAFETGELELPLFEFFFYDAEGNQNSRIAPITSVFIQSVLPADKAADSLLIKDIVGPKSLPILWWPYIVGGIILILLAAFLYYYFKRKTRDIEIPEIPPEPPYDVAIRGLTKLKEKNLPNKGKYKQYYIELSDIIRHYIEGRFEIRAVESTTFELKRILKHPDLTRDQVKETIDFLSRADMIKFAKQIPSVEIPDRDYEQIKNFVINTRPVEQPEKETEAIS